MVQDLGGSWMDRELTDVFVSETDEIRIASMSSILANGALIAGDFRAAEEFFKEARYGFGIVFLISF